MRRVVYGGSAVTTTDDVADALMTLAVTVVGFGHTEAVSIPIAVSMAPGTGVARLVIGPGISLMTEPAEWDGDEPDFSDGVTFLRMNSYYPRDAAFDRSASPAEASDPWRPGFEDW